MSIWKVTSNGPQEVSETKFKQEEVLEESLEDWVVDDSALLGESLLIIGRQVIVPDINDRLDLLALDPQGNAVVVELKRGQLKDPVDMQALRYASYISRWAFEDFENHARSFFGKVGDPDFNLNETFEQFCAEAGVDEIPDINADQRIIVVGAEIKAKLGSVALWLRDHSIDIKVVEIEVYKQSETILLQPRTIIPLPVSSFADIGRAGRGDVAQPWRKDGRAWHLEKRCTPRTKEILLRLDSLIQESLEVDGPRWSQKFYVAYRVGNYNWLTIRTRSKLLQVQFNVEAGHFDQAELAERLNVAEFNEEDTLSDKLNLPSSLHIENRSETTDRINLRVKDDFDLESEQFTKFLTDAYDASPR
jgi:hypothetical protein